jgi:hypothetical protein
MGTGRLFTKAEELVGLKGQIQKIERLQYTDAQQINGKWHIGKNNYFRKTDQIFDRDGLLLRDSIGYVGYKLNINSIYYYYQGKMSRVERLDPIGNLEDMLMVSWPTKYTAVATQLDKDGKCLYKLYWYYNSNFSLNKYINTNGCDHKNPEADLDTKAIYHYDSNGFNNKRDIFDPGHDGVRYYNVLEKDIHGNPLAIVERFIEAASNKETQTLSLYRYTYYNEKPQIENYKNVILAENIDSVPAVENESAGQFNPEEQQQEVADRVVALDEVEIAALVNDEACINHDKYTLKQRLQFYPFNRAKKVALISYKDAAVVAELYADNNKLPDLARADKVVVLNSREIDELTNTIYNIGYAKPIFMKTLAIDCTAIKNAIVFIDGNDKPFEYILLYFGCNQYSYSSDKVKDGDYCAGKFDLLKQHFAAKGIPTAP